MGLHPDVRAAIGSGARAELVELLDEADPAEAARRIEADLHQLADWQRAAERRAATHDALRRRLGHARTHRVICTSPTLAAVHGRGEALYSRLKSARAQADLVASWLNRLVEYHQRTTTSDEGIVVVRDTAERLNAAGAAYQQACARADFLVGGDTSGEG